MEYRRVGDSELVVSAIGLGSWLTYGDRLSAERSEACIRRALDLGVTLFDTANVYGRGGAEELLGRALRAVERSSYVLATKVYFPMSRTDMGLSAEQVRKQCDASLARLDTDYIDLYQCHRFDTTTPLEETLSALAALQRDGKVRAVGVCNWSTEQVRAALASSELPRFAADQQHYSLLTREPASEVFELCHANGIGNLCWSPLEQGILTGKYRAGSPPPTNSRAEVTRGRTMGAMLKDSILRLVEGVAGIAAEHDLTTAQLALAWVLRTGTVSAALVGATRPEQLDETMGAASVELGEDALAQIDALLAARLATAAPAG
ncbi:MAG: aldo/keto reductase [Solirubrobacteraceae bacterium]